MSFVDSNERYEADPALYEQNLSSDFASTFLELLDARSQGDAVTDVPEDVRCFEPDTSGSEEGRVDEESTVTSSSTVLKVTARLPGGGVLDLGNITRPVAVSRDVSVSARPRVVKENERTEPLAESAVDEATDDDVREGVVVGKSERGERRVKRVGGAILKTAKKSVGATGAALGTAVGKAAEVTGEGAARGVQAYRAQANKEIAKAEVEADLAELRRCAPSGVQISVNKLEIFKPKSETEALTRGRVMRMALDEIRRHGYDYEFDGEGGGYLYIPEPIEPAPTPPPTWPYVNPRGAN